MKRPNKLGLIAFGTALTSIVLWGVYSCLRDEREWREEQYASKARFITRNIYDLKERREFKQRIEKIDKEFEARAKAAEEQLEKGWAEYKAMVEDYAAKRAETERQLAAIRSQRFQVRLDAYRRRLGLQNN
jgi:hypothetical protein